jgi:hypothetical protein
VIRPYREAVTEAAHRFDGFIAKFMGDGVLVYFGYPHAQEKDAERAVHAGLAIPDTLPALNRRFARVDGIRLAVRIASRPGSSWSNSEFHKDASDAVSTNRQRKIPDSDRSASGAPAVPAAAPHRRGQSDASARHRKST